MTKCIFCMKTSGPFTTREHVLPESLGGSDWAVLPGGLVCDQCQNRFGSSIEQQALGDYPFSFLRVLLGIPTKKGKAPWLKSWEGAIHATRLPGVIGYEPAPAFREAMELGRKTGMSLLAHPLKPQFVCRFLLKMGIEVIGADDSELVFEKRFDDARDFALLGIRRNDWWYLQHEDITAARHYIAQGVSPREWTENVILEVVELDHEAELFHLKLLYMDLLVPLVSCILPPPADSLQEPEYRLFPA